jgi:hypothetical protein
VGNRSITYFLKFLYFTIFSVQEEATDDMLADFEREATLLSEFDHPNIGNPHSDLSMLLADLRIRIHLGPRSRKLKTASKKRKKS